MAEIESGFGKNLPSFIKAATAVMYMNNLKGKKKNEGEVEVLDDENIRLYQLLIKNNLFEYHFQPIVNATDGEICAFEALMRTPKNIGLNPLQIIATAKKCNGLYDLEKRRSRNRQLLWQSADRKKEW